MKRSNGGHAAQAAAIVAMPLTIDVGLYEALRNMMH
jgi:hypothetical protein